MTLETALQSLRTSLLDVQQKRLPIASFCQAWRAERTLLAALPPRYEQVMEDILARMEAASMFAEESCSFSHDDLHASLAVWLDKADQALSGDSNANA